jgi:hypothetical protein
VPGIGLISLNGSPLPYQGDNGGPIEISLPEIRERNELIIELSLPETDTSGPEGSDEWGDIALIIRKSHC